VASSDSVETELQALFSKAEAEVDGGSRRFDAVVKVMIAAYDEHVRRLAVRRGVSSSRIDNVSSLTWEAVPTKLESFKGKSPFLRWLLGIAAYKALDERKRGRRDKLHDPLSGPKGTGETQADSSWKRPSRLTAEHERKRQLDKIVAQLSPDDRKLYEARFRQHRALEDIAREAGVPYNTLVQRVLRLEKRLKALLLAAMQG
jgi:RNA polymerase sigma factor (sigma-70 family)